MENWQSAARHNRSHHDLLVCRQSSSGRLNVGTSKNEYLNQNVLQSAVIAKIKGGPKSVDSFSADLGMNADSVSLERNSPFEKVDYDDNENNINQFEDYEESKELKCKVN